jgi:hypothetical protein
MRRFLQKRKEKKKALKAAGQAFQKDFPDKSLCGYIGRVKYDEPRRYVIEVCCGSSRPPKAAFYAIDKDDSKVYQVHNSKYERTYKR